jgi:hypothetical protein
MKFLMVSMLCYYVRMKQRAQAAAEWINHGLEEGQHCIFMLPSLLLINFINQVFLEFRQR